MAQGAKSPPLLPFLVLPTQMFADWYIDILRDLRKDKPLDKAVKNAAKDFLALQDRVIDDARQVRYKAVEVQSQLIERYREMLEELEKRRSRRTRRGQRRRGKKK